MPVRLLAALALALAALPAAAQRGAAAPPGLPPAAAEAFDALPADVRARIAEWCADDLGCVRRAIRREQRPTRGGPRRVGVGEQGPVADREAAARISTPATGAATGAASGAGDRLPPGTFGPGARRGDAPLPPPPNRGEPDRDRAGGNLPPGTTGPGANRPAPDTHDPVEVEPEPSPYEGYVGPDPDAGGPEAVHFYYGAPEDTDLSGEEGYIGIVKQPGNGAYLIGIESEERSDQPCGFRFLWYRDNDADVRQGYFTTTGGRCLRAVDWDETYGSNRHKNATIDLFLQPTDDQVQAVRSLQVCMNRHDNRIKGVRVWGARIDRNGRAVADDDIEGEFQRLNCHAWVWRRDCPSGEVAVGIRVRYGYAHDTVSGTTHLGSATGMELICADPYTVTR